MKKDNPRTVEEAIDQAARLAAPVFAAMGWVWYTTSPHTPTIEDIKRLYRELYDSGLSAAGTGRLTVERRASNVEFGIELAVLNLPYEEFSVNVPKQPVNPGALPK